jgi:hypothetical protein
MSCFPGDNVTNGPLETPGWIEFNTWRTGLTAHRYVDHGNSGDRLEAQLYLDRRGRVAMPPNNPYLAVRFETGRTTPASRTAAWLRASKGLLDELNERGLANQIHLPPGITDVRPFTWDGYRTSVRYTYILDLPVDEGLLSRGTRKAIRRSEAAGYTVERTEDLDAVLACLVHAEQRQGFSHGLGRRELDAAARLMGPDGMRMYVAFDAHGVPASAVVNLHAPGSRAIGWLSGTAPTALRDGPGLAVLRHEFADLAAAGATSVDLYGANIESIAEFKSHWGPELVPTYSLREYSMRSTARFILDWRNARRLQRTAAKRRAARAATAATTTVGRWWRSWAPVVIVGFLGA